MAITKNLNLPILRNGEEYISRSTKSLESIQGQKLLDISISSDIHIQMAMPMNKLAGFNKLQEMSIDELISIYAEAGNIFSQDLEIKGLYLSNNEWSELITLSTGMPITYVRNTFEMIKEFLSKEHLTRFLKANSPTGELAIYDENIAIRGTVFGWSPKGRNVGVALPSNHPAVSLMGVLSPLMKIPTIIRASSQEPFTSYKLCKSLWEAGLPYETLFHFVTDHSAVDTIVRQSDLGIIFGSDWTIKQYGDNNSIKAYGPGQSKVIIDFDQMSDFHMDMALDVAYNSITIDGGRGCINASGIVFMGSERYDEFKNRLAEQLAKIKPLDILDPRAVLPAMKKEPAKQLHSFVESRIDYNVLDLTAKYRGDTNWMIEKNALTYFLPTLLEMPEDHKMATDEYPWPFGTIIQPEDSLAHEAARNSLSVAYLTDKVEKAKKLLVEPTIQKVFLNEITFTHDIAAPHEGFLGDFLYHTKATNIRP